MRTGEYAGRPFDVELFVVNTGNSPATLAKYYYRIPNGDWELMDIPHSWMDDVKEILEPGYSGFIYLGRITGDNLGRLPDAFEVKLVIIESDMSHREIVLQNPRRSAEEEREFARRKTMLAQAPQLLVGTWRDENSSTTYDADQTFVSRSDEDGMTRKGTWKIEGDLLITLNKEKDGEPLTPPKRYEDQILELTHDKFTVSEHTTRLGPVWHAVRVAGFSPKTPK